MMASNDTKSLFYPFEKGYLHMPDQEQTVLFINASYEVNLKSYLSKANSTLIQPDFVQAKQLEKWGFDVLPVWPDEGRSYDFVLIRLPKQCDQAHYFMAKGFSYLAKEGTLMCAAANDAGGSRIEKDLQKVLIESPVQVLSKYKSRVVFWTKKENTVIQEDTLTQWNKKGALQLYDGHGFWTRAGIFGWDKIDKGSKILTDHLPDTLKGCGADFGCGYGFISSYILRGNKEIEELYCIDSDMGALEPARKNLEKYQTGKDIHFVWDDLTAPVSDLPACDFIVMNPPFHHQKKQDTSIGLKFIETAAKFLRRGGVLWMVANIQLPYENKLEILFSRYECVTEQNGFKVFCAIK